MLAVGPADQGTPVALFETHDPRALPADLFLAFLVEMAVRPVRWMDEMQGRRRDVDLACDRSEVVACALAGDQSRLFEQRALGTPKQTLEASVGFCNRGVVDGEDIAKREPLGALGQAQEGNLGSELALRPESSGRAPDQALCVDFLGQHVRQRQAVLDRVVTGPCQHDLERWRSPLLPVQHACARRDREQQCKCRDAGQPTRRFPGRHRVTACEPSR